MDQAQQTSPVFALDSVTQLDERAHNLVLIAASHGGVYSGFLAAKWSVRAAIFNDAGIGLDEAGIAGLAYLDQLGVPAAAVSHASCRIGDAHDMVERGMVSRVNEAARQLGCVPGLKTRDCAIRMVGARTPAHEAPPAQEGRFLLDDAGDGPKVLGVDSASLVMPEDAGQIVVAGSHGGLMGGNAAAALKVDALAAVFNDAGLGIDRAGVTRLPVLNQRGIPAATVGCMTARIGDARSSWETGRLTHANALAAEAGAARDMPLPEFAECVRDWARKRAGAA